MVPLRRSDRRECLCCPRSSSLATTTPARLPPRVLLQLVVTDDTSSSSPSHSDAHASEHQLRSVAETLKQTGEFQSVQ
eukprot:44409-Eustigmatos_ZCMA.PRE.1